ncbi:hypothetical protein PRIPAC_80588 [Pristionchus pacificus]|uniref:Uncharacterized protein n=1 Tax=Pristionchus pacificus TaxID=54126 RepID=A0A2A6BVV5_PRIPA|nr:hypothetical protein PRIPAC_80588 [Pristionchus pacificus]|eukprot:PDM70034.1 hypothetical protein PRIPAC_49246 [Pristionchus pacificus]
MSPFSLFHKMNRVKLELFLDLPMPAIVSHLRACGLLRSTLMCPKCAVPCVEYQLKKSPSWPGCGWRCNNCATTFSALRDSWFSRTRIDIRPLLRMLYAFSWEQASFRSVQHELRCPDGSTISRQTFVDYCRYVFYSFCKVCTLSLFPTISHYSDCWAAYHRISNIGKYTHLTVNHSVTFKDKVTRACTNGVEGMWQRLKLGHKRRFGTHRSQLPSHIGAAVFFIRHELEDRFEAMLRAISENFPIK